MPVPDVTISVRPRMLPDVRRRPVRSFLAIDQPDRLAGGRVERGEVRAAVVVVDNVEAALVQHGRRRRAPAVARRLERSGDRPQQPAVEVVGEDADVAERHVDALAVGDRRLGRVGVLQVARRRRNAAMRLALPRDLAGGEVDRVHHPAVFDLSAPGVRRRSRGRALGASTCPDGITDVTKMRSPHAIGDDQPWPGIAVFHARSRVVLHVSGRAGAFADARRSRTAKLRPLARLRG